MPATPTPGGERGEPKSETSDTNDLADVPDPEASGRGQPTDDP